MALREGAIAVERRPSSKQFRMGPGAPTMKAVAGEGLWGRQKTRALRRVEG